MRRYERIMQAVNPRDEHGRPLMPTGEQREVIECEDSAILVVAGAGSGKTRTMANRIAYWVGAGKVEPSQVLGLTFTRKAAGELESRVAQSLAALERAGLGPSRSVDGETDRARRQLEMPTISTYNSFAADIAASYGLLVGADPSARLMTEAERFQLMGAVVDSLGEDVAQAVDSARTTVVEQALAVAAALIDNGRAVDEARRFYAEQEGLFAEIAASQSGRKIAWKRHLGGEERARTYRNAWGKLASAASKMRQGLVLCDIVEEYFRRKADEGLMEFADQVAVAVKVFEAVPSLREEVSARHALVLLDEYQDTSVSQARLLSLALSAGEAATRSVVAVGDPNQAIYGWRGASANAFADFPQVFESLGRPALFSLQTTFRNDTAILEAANVVAERIETSSVEVGRLRPRTNAGPGRVVEIRPLRREDSYRAMAMRMRDRMREIRDAEGRPAEMAVLCRKRSYIPLAAKALGDAGVPYEIVGGESLLMRPEVATVRAALEAAANPARGDWLARLCAFASIGIEDMRALARHARAAAGAELEGIEGGGTIDAGEEATLVEGLDALGSQPPEGMSREGHRRFVWLASVLRDIRDMENAPLGELAFRAARLLGMYLLAASRPEGARRVTTSLDSFSAVASQYASEHPEAGLGDFLEWLDAVEAREHGGEAASGMDERLSGPDVDVNPGVVQIMTIHGSKGLEWRDIVALPEMVEGGFDEPAAACDLWPASAKVFPYPLRADSRHLPRFAPKVPAEGEDGPWAPVEEYLGFAEAERLHEGQEARRLAYVAMTRPQAELLLVGYGIADSGQAVEKLRAGKPVPVRRRSAFLEGIETEPIAGIAGEGWARAEGREAADRLCFLCPQSLEADEFVALLDEEEKPGEGPEPIPDYSRGQWRTFPADRARPAIGESEVDAQAAMEALDAREKEIEVLLAELRDAGAEHPLRMSRPYLTATDVVTLARDPRAFEADLVRPIPREPSRNARIGTRVHEAIAESYLLAPRLDLDHLDGSVRVEADETVEAFFATYSASRWASYRPLLVEASMSVVVAGHVVRCTVDAVLDTARVPGMRKVTIVDWKTGTQPRRGQLASREMQLALYRLAYSKVSGVPLEDIGAFFVYLDEKGSVGELEAGELSEESILALVEAGMSCLSAPVRGG